ncbi:unnamed protein product [Pedinophyceae sp. YPF-701]|nr:unnamed protein product [Pedinophyceae sp. YPF-701]
MAGMGKEEKKKRKLERDPASKGEKKAKKAKRKQPPVSGSGEGVNVEGFDSAEKVSELGMERVTAELQRRGMKCGGSLMDRAERLFLLNSHSLDELPPKTLAKSTRSALAAAEKDSGTRPDMVVWQGNLVLVNAAREEVYDAKRTVKDASGAEKPLVIGTWDIPTRSVRLDPAQAGAVSARAAKKARLEQQLQAAQERRAGTLESVEHAFQADEDDHCETSLEAYCDVAPLLDRLASRLGRTRATLRIYDPYYCAGGVERHLGALGFQDVYNRNEDFYEVARRGEVPEHDVVVTNPPYSHEHICKLLKWCRINGRPWLLLLPNYVYQKDYYGDVCLGRSPASWTKCEGLFYLAPRKRYYYWTPKALKRGKSTHGGSLGERTSPFISFWYICMQDHAKDITNWFQSKQGIEKKRRIVAARKAGTTTTSADADADPDSGAPADRPNSGAQDREAVVEDDAKVLQNGLGHKELQKALEGATVDEARRKGKVVWARLKSGPSVLFHFGMTGSFSIKGKAAMEYKSFRVDEESWPPKWTKVELVMDDGTALAYSDPRRFGKIWLQDDPFNQPPVSALGWDPVLSPIDLDAFRAAMLASRKPVKAVLLDQAFSAGVGNWVADEALYQARVHPEQPCNSLTPDAAEALHRAVIGVCKDACDVGARSSKFPPDWLFHFRWTGKKASNDYHGNKIEFITVGGRTSAYVPKLQKKTSVKPAGDGGDAKPKVSKAKKPKGKIAKKRKRASSSEESCTDMSDDDVIVEPPPKPIPRARGGAKKDSEDETKAVAKKPAPKKASTAPKRAAAPRAAATKARSRIASPRPR